MTRPTTNYILDWSTLLVMGGLAGTGLLIHFSLPAGSGGNSVLGLTRHDWGDVHFWIAMGFLALITVHLLLHVSWIKAMTVAGAKGSKAWRRAGYAVAGLLAVIALIATLLSLPVSPGTGGGRGEGRGYESQSGEQAGGGGGMRRGGGRFNAN